MALTPAATDPNRGKITRALKDSSPNDKDKVKQEWNLDLDKSPDLKVKEAVNPPPAEPEGKKSK